MPHDEIQIIDLTPDTIGSYGVCGYKDVTKHVELQRKIEWFRNLYPEGLRIKALITRAGGYQGMIEFIPAQHAHRPVQADGYMFIHCIFVGFKKEYKGRGFAKRLIDSCINDARDANMAGVAVVTRKGSFMARRDIFLKMGFEPVDTALPDFELLACSFRAEAQPPSFIITTPEIWPDGLTILRSPQCPYSVKNVEAIVKTARAMNIDTNVIEIDSAEKAQTVPGPFGTFCIVYNGRVISHHPISNTRFVNIMKKELSDR